MPNLSYIASTKNKISPSIKSASSFSVIDCTWDCNLSKKLYISLATSSLTLNPSPREPFCCSSSSFFKSLLNSASSTWLFLILSHLNLSTSLKPKLKRICNSLSRGASSSRSNLALTSLATASSDKAIVS